MNQVSASLCSHLHLYSTCSKKVFFCVAPWSARFPISRRTWVLQAPGSVWHLTPNTISSRRKLLSRNFKIQKVSKSRDFWSQIWDFSKISKMWKSFKKYNVFRPQAMTSKHAKNQLPALILTELSTLNLKMDLIGWGSPLWWRRMHVIKICPHDYFKVRTTISIAKPAHFSRACTFSISTCSWL